MGARFHLVEALAKEFVTGNVRAQNAGHFINPHIEQLEAVAFHVIDLFVKNGQQEHFCQVFQALLAPQKVLAVFINSISYEVESIAVGFSVRWPSCTR